METVLKINALNHLQKGTVIFRKGESIHCIGAVLQGSVRILSSGIQRIAQKGAMIGLSDLFYGRYLCSYLVEEDAVIYPFSITDRKALEEFLYQKPEYRGIAVYSMAVELSEFLNERERLLSFAGEQYERLKKQGEPPDELFSLHSSADKISNYQEYAKVLLDIHKKYYYNSKVMAFYQTGEIAEVIREVLNSSGAIAEYLDGLYREECGGTLFEEELPSRETIEKCFASVKNVSEEKVPVSEDESGLLSIEDVTTALQHSLRQILSYSGIGAEKQGELRSAIELFVNAKDRLSTQDEMRRIKKQITTYFFEVYELCVFRWFSDEDAPLAVKLFLNYGYMDERLLDGEQIFFLYERLNEKHGELACPVYTMPEWLKAIYEGEKEPSRNSFEQDYRDFLREEKRTGKITEKQEKELLEDKAGRVRFEIHNMFTSNNKIVNGKLSTYVPVLYKDEIYGHLDRLYLTKDQLCRAILELEKIDFTVFQREVLYTNPALKIEKEYVLKHVYPDVILCPVYGTACSMWQEITGKKRDTPGRFLFSVITENEIEKLVMKAFGRFHWEYCRCEQGPSWNNIQYKSLTSEYMDYIQYYRKNHSLSEEKRQKIKAQILRARNNSREVFLIDYELWMGYEANAAMKLNKVARAILATYCPFNKEIRESLKSNAAFAEAMMGHQKRFGEKKREWEMRIKRRENKNLEIPEEFYNTYRYYADN